MVDAATRETMRTLGQQLGLSDEQKEKAAALVESAIQDRLDAVKDLTTAMRDDPEAMMEMFLAGDAVARGEMTREEYDLATADTRLMLENIGGYVLGRNPNAAGAPLFGDVQFNNELAAILLPEQQEQMAEVSRTMAERAERQSVPNMPLQGGNIPVMELEKLEQTVSSARTMTAGLRQVFEGLEGLQQNLEP